MPSIYDYFSYHTFLNEWLQAAHEKNARFSQREFLRRGGISGSATLHRVLQGSRLPEKYFFAFAKALDLADGEREYFRNLVQYEDAKTIQERAAAFSALLRLRSVFPQYKIDDRALRFFKRWYYPVVREIVHLLNGSEDYNKISRMVIPPITVTQAQNAVRFLEKNDFLKRNESGCLELSEPFFSTGERRVSGLLSAYHLKNLEINASAVELVEKEFLSMSSLTLTVSEKTYQQMRDELTAFRTKLLGMAREDQNPERVFHLNFTFLPRSKNSAAKEGEE